MVRVVPSSTCEILVTTSSHKHTGMYSGSVLHVLFDARKILMKCQLYTMISMIFASELRILDIFLVLLSPKNHEKSRVDFQNAVKWDLLNENSNFRFFSVSTLNLLQNGSYRLFQNDFNFARKLILQRAFSVKFDSDFHNF